MQVWEYTKMPRLTFREEAVKIASEKGLKWCMLQILRRRKLKYHASSESLLLERKRKVVSAIKSWKRVQCPALIVK